MSKKRRDPQTPFGWYLRALMEAHGFASDGELAAATGVSASLISRYQSGDIEPSVQNLRRLAPYLGVSLGELMVEANLATREELGMVPRAAATTKLDASLAEAQRLLSDPTRPDSAKEYLRDTLRGAIAFWRQQTGLKAPAEPSAAERAVGRGVRAA
ncbi:helix-turn-helix transcriptional regulator [Hamadaea sp.]|uniref:helix-turn-helix domain-containing protein n=1 Tax=Hamadaea sp. TaxID=2024425 RepID=UPI0025BA8F91|nr:helix-turn-helix transcriptional regulator [Hamadaea sp.]